MINLKKCKIIYGHIAPAHPYYWTAELTFIFFLNILIIELVDGMVHHRRRYSWFCGEACTVQEVVLLVFSSVVFSFFSILESEFLKSRSKQRFWVIFMRPFDIGLRKAVMMWRLRDGHNKTSALSWRWIGSIWEGEFLMFELFEFTQPPSKCRWPEVPACFTIQTIERGSLYQTRKWSKKLALQLPCHTRFCILDVVLCWRGLHQSIWAFSFTIQYLHSWAFKRRIFDPKKFPKLAQNQTSQLII